jgi:hypothetical protein
VNGRNGSTAAEPNRSSWPILGLLITLLLLLNLLLKLLLLLQVLVVLVTCDAATDGP